MLIGSDLFKPVNQVLCSDFGLDSIFDVSWSASNPACPNDPKLDETPLKLWWRRTHPLHGQPILRRMQYDRQDHDDEEQGGDQHQEGLLQEAPLVPHAAPGVVPDPGRAAGDTFREDTRLENPVYVEKDSTPHLRPAARC